MRRATALCRSLSRLSGPALNEGSPAASAALLAGRCKPLSSVTPMSVSSSLAAPSRGGLGLRGFAGEAAESDVFYPAQQAFVGHQAPRFTAPAFTNGDISYVSLDDYLSAGKYVVLAFYPKDFTYVCPTEIIAFSDRAKEFEDAGAQVLVASTDTEEVHGAWTRVARSAGGLGKIAIPMVADTKKTISAAYGCLHEDSGLALRGLYIISPDGILHHSTVNNFPVGRSVDEALRTLKAIKFVAEHGEVCPAGWQPGDPTMKAGIESSKEYFGTLADSPESPLAPTLQAVESRSELDALVSSNDAVVLDCLANWCGKCHQLAPFVEELQQNYKGKVAFAKLDTEAFKALSEELGVSVLPTFKVFKGGKEVSTVVGYKKKLLADAVAKVAA